MEVTSNPALSTEMVDSTSVIHPMVRDVITMTSDLHEKNIDKGRNAMLERAFSCASQHYDVIYKENGV